MQQLWLSASGGRQTSPSLHLFTLSHRHKHHHLVLGDDGGDGDDGDGDDDRVLGDDPNGLAPDMTSSHLNPFSSYKHDMMMMT